MAAVTRRQKLRAEGRFVVKEDAMRPVVRLASLVICALLLMNGTAMGQQPKHGGVLVFGINSGDLPTYDCHQSTLFPIIHLLSPHYSNLLKIDLKNYPKLAGDLAES